MSKPPASFGTWTSDTVKAGTVQADIRRNEGGAFVGFPTREGEVVYLKIGLSFKSLDQSARWLHDEIPGWDISALASRARQAWNDELTTVTADGGDDEEIGRFYTGLFHTMVQPRDRTGDLWDTSEPCWDDHYTL